MKRYRTTLFSFGARATNLNIEALDSWKPEAKILHEKNRQKTIEGLKWEFGARDFDQKFKNFIDMGSAFPSIVFFHNKFLDQIRKSFVMGAYYPAFTGVTTLMERILNHLIFALREDFRSTVEYKEVYGKKSFTDWDMMERILTSWKVLLPETKQYIQKLKKLHHQYAAHFNPETDIRDRELSLEALKLFQEFIKVQFGAFGLQPWFIRCIFYKKRMGESPIHQENLYTELFISGA